MPDFKATLRQIAVAANCSRAAVSYAVNLRPGVSEELRKRILKLAFQFNYPVRSALYALILAPRAGGFGYDGLMLSALHKEAIRRHCHLQMIFQNDLQFLDERRLSGAISLDYHSEISSYFSEKKNLPLVCINDPGNLREGIFSVRSDDAGVMELLLTRLIRRGYRKIGLLLDSLSRRDRFFVPAAKKLPVEGRILRLDESPNFFDAIPEFVRWADVLIVPNEYMELGIRSELWKAGFRIPHDTGAIFWENPQVSHYMDPPSTTVEQDFNSMAKAAFDLLEARLGNLSENLHNVTVPYILHERETDPIKNKI